MDKEIKEKKLLNLELEKVAKALEIVKRICDLERLRLGLSQDEARALSTLQKRSLFEIRRSELADETLLGERIIHHSEQKPW